MKAMLLASFRGTPTVQAIPPARAAAHESWPESEQRYWTIMGQRFEVAPAETRDMIERARRKHHQSVLPLDPASRPYVTPEELVQFGVSKIRQLAQQVRSELEPELDVRRDTRADRGCANASTLRDAGRRHDRRLRVGQVIHDAVMHYFHAGLKACNKARLSADGTTPLQDVRSIVRQGTTSSLHHDLQFDIQRTQLALAAYGDGNCDSQAHVCALIAKALQLPHAIVGIGDVAGPRSVFGHTLMVLTPEPLDVSDLQGRRCGSVADLDKDWVAVDPWSKIVCTGDQYAKQVEHKLRKWEGEGKVLLHHGHRIALSPRSEHVLRSLGEGALTFPHPDAFYGFHPGLAMHGLAIPGPDPVPGGAGADPSTAHPAGAGLARQARIRAQLHAGAGGGAPGAERPR